jgi:hypothetical protein
MIFFYSPMGQNRRAALVSGAGLPAKIEFICRQFRGSERLLTEPTRSVPPCPRQDVVELVHDHPAERPSKN